ncbi:MAG: arylmalonate decarboxylase [Alphaproteobacteria bacterium]
MTDSLGFRKTFGVIAPSTNTSVQPEYDDMRPPGVTNHFSRAVIPDTKVTDDESFMVMLNNIRAAVTDAIESVMTCHPDYVIMGMSAETFWDGTEGSQKLHRKLEDTAGVKVAMGSDGCRAALEAYGGIRRIAVVTPYMPVADRNVIRFFSESGYDVVRLKGLKCASPSQIAQVSPQQLRDALIELNGPDVDALVQVGTNLAMAAVAAKAEFWFDKPVVAINTATYWYALRQNGIDDRIPGFGRLLAEF